MLCAMRQVSEFARRLKAHRVRFGTHGRMTQVYEACRTAGIPQVAIAVRPR